MAKSQAVKADKGGGTGRVTESGKQNVKEIVAVPLVRLNGEPLTSCGDPKLGNRCRTAGGRSVQISKSKRVLDRYRNGPVPFKTRGAIKRGIKPLAEGDQRKNGNGPVEHHQNSPKEQGSKVRTLPAGS